MKRGVLSRWITNKGGVENEPQKKEEQKYAGDQNWECGTKRQEYLSF